MSFIGTGDEDWVELDLDLFERARSIELESFLDDDYDRVANTIGFDFEVETATDGLVFIVVDGQRRFRAEVGANGRLIFTGIPNPEGPL